MLEDFEDAMLLKFVARHRKQHDQGNKSVLDENFDWSRDLNIEVIENHLRDEFYEWEAAESDEKVAEEDIDLANMAFLDWVLRRGRLNRRP